MYTKTERLVAVMKGEEGGHRGGEGEAERVCGKETGVREEATYKDNSQGKHM